MGDLDLLFLEIPALATLEQMLNLIPQQEQESLLEEARQGRLQGWHVIGYCCMVTRTEDEPDGETLVTIIAGRGQRMLDVLEFLQKEGLALRIGSMRRGMGRMLSRAGFHCLERTDTINLYEWRP